MKRLYVGNFPYQTTKDELKVLFSDYGEVTYATVIDDRETGRPKGFGFIEFADDNNAMRALQELDGAMFQGRPLRVNEAHAKKDNGSGGGGARPQGGGGRGRNARDAAGEGSQYQETWRDQRRGHERNRD